MKSLKTKYATSFFWLPLFFALMLPLHASAHNCDFSAVLASSGHKIADAPTAEEFYYVFLRDRCAFNDDGYRIIFYKEGVPTLPEDQTTWEYPYHSFLPYDLNPGPMEAARLDIMDPDNEAVIVMGHDRNGTGGVGNHPFTFEWGGRTFSFMHNGSIPLALKEVLWDELYNDTGDHPGQWFEEHPSNWNNEPETWQLFIDSEILFHWIMKYVIKNEGVVLQGIHEALTATLNQGAINLYTEFHDNWDSHKINFVLSDGEALYVFRNTDPDEIETHNVSYEVYPNEGFIAVKTQTELANPLLQYTLVYIPRTAQPLAFDNFLDLDVGHTLYVDDDNTTEPFEGTLQDPFQFIQQGIDAAEDLQTVCVMPGTYMENIDFSGKAIVVKSTDGADLTFIDADQMGSVVTLANQEGPLSVLDGFTVQGGNAQNGGGIYCWYAAPKIINCIITENSVTHYGGGVYAKNSSLLLDDNLIKDNSALSGGGIHCRDTSSPVMTDNTVSGNFASWGAGIYVHQCQSTIVNNIITSNIASNTGGGIRCNYASSLQINNTVYGNSALAGLEGGGIYCSHCALTLINSIVWNNAGEAVTYEGDVPWINYCNIEGEWPQGVGNIAAQPCFTNPMEGDFHLQFQSPCKDAGFNTVYPSLDFEGDPRISFNTVDMGADEFYNHLYVSGNPTPGGVFQLNFIGVPGTLPVYLLYGLALLDTPAHTLFGVFYLSTPFFIIPSFPAIPANGHLSLGVNVPAFPPAPYDIPMQALLGLNPDSLSSLCMLKIR